MEHEDNQPHHNTDDQRHGDDQDHQQRGIGRSIRPGTAVPPTVLVADMGDGSLETAGMIIEGEVLANGPLTLPAYTVEPHWEP